MNLTAKMGNLYENSTNQKFAVTMSDVNCSQKSAKATVAMHSLELCPRTKVNTSLPNSKLYTFSADSLSIEV